MATRTIIHEGDAILRKHARPIEKFDTRLGQQAQDLLDTLRMTNNGIGLAAPQIGLLKRMFAIDMRDGSEPRLFLNPEISECSGEQKSIEGCLSLPGLYGEVVRPARLHIKAQDVDGEYFEMDVDGLEAICICHENDHLDGILFTDKVEGDLERR